ncbi:hypothetical protein ACSLBF_18230 (plasmid) [Pseudoalteromonas sp. T1lg65]|uniref:hypothetical protein n=1 Tax=Pseudoalteromonas sp. T1lg65 TaxID=2077101 RepID=UPI003F7A887D
MKLKLNKKKLTNLSKDQNTLANDMTPQVVGGLKDITDLKPIIKPCTGCVSTCGIIPPFDDM